MFGDYPDEPESDAGAPPATTPDVETPAGSEGSELPETAGEPPADPGDVPAPDTGTSETPTDPDPLEGAASITYMVDGQERTYDGITVLKNGAGIVEPEKVADLQRKLGERDHLFETGQAQYAKLQAFDKATEWKDGDRVLTGVPALEAQRVFIAQAAITINELAAILQPENFWKYAAIGQNPDGTHYIQPDQEALKGLRERLAFVTEREGFNARREFSQRIPQTATPQPAATSDASVESMAPQTVVALASQMKVTLSDDSKAFLIGELPRYVRATTPEERPTYGARIVDKSFANLIQREAKTATATKQIAETTTAAAKANAARLAAANPGGKSKQPARITPTKEPERTRDDDFDDLWDQREKAAAGALRAAHAVQ